MACLCAGAVSAQEATLSERLRALNAPAPVDPYADERQSDLALIARHAPDLFGAEGAVIAMFIGPDCPTCANAGQDLRAMAKERGLDIRIHDSADPKVADLMAALGLDVLPSYVMKDRLIRGDMPAFVLARYLSE
ncbi:hypothetical protein [Mameliella sediminis]|uniref:hypothetical protein n=1 Tax=Mameliella sediminis TaxID=2836866 RepID=UPI001C4373A0|nr:hypothetical protein [Mameliella sediminis]MBV7393163.1 hypothetical protein [Mameliella sediminis]